MSIFAEIGRSVMLVGVLSIFLGILVTFTGKMFLIGKLPGDLYVRKWGLHFYLPLTSAILITLFLNWVLKSLK